MKFTLSWLKDHLETQASLEEIVTKLVDLGIEVESVEDPAEKLKPFVIGHVVECGRHPNADRLSLCRVDAGTGELIQVVCGAPNVRQGMKVAFAPLGAVIPVTGQPLKKGKIRDVESCGMLCSARELELGEDSDGIMDLQTDAAPGTSFVEVLGLNDPIIEVSLTPNRSDCFSVRGIARDLAAAGLGTLKNLPTTVIEGQFECPLSVHIEDTKNCSAFRGMVIRGVKNGESPDWVQCRLKAIGLRPISALVDVTNYLNYDMGRPMHVFDMDKVTGGLVIRSAEEGEKLLALNEKEYTLEEGMTVIADKEGPLSLGGIMGGSASGCSDSTTTVFIESALFNPITIAETGRALNIISDSRTRFERGVDAELVEPALHRAAALIIEWCGGIPSQCVGVKPASSKPFSIILTHEKLGALSGLDISLTEAAEYLEKLGFTVTHQTTTELTVTVPSWRHDCEGPADLVEEVLRLKGYHTIPAAPLPFMHQGMPVPSVAIMAKRLLASRGFNEVVTWSFISEKEANLFCEGADLQHIANPISQDLSVMRPSILPNLLQAAGRNCDRGNGSGLFCEVGPQYSSQSQSLMATGIRFGHTPRHWLTSTRSVDVYDSKADVLAVLATLGVFESALQIDTSTPSYYHPGRSGCFKQGNKVIAYFGDIHPSVLEEFSVDVPVVGFEIFLDRLPPVKMKKAILQLSPYQAVTRDFAFVIDQKVPADAVVKAVMRVDRNLITDTQVFDVYAGDKLETAKKSLAIQVRLEPKDRTLTDAEIQEVASKIIATVEKLTGGVLRQS